MDTPNIKVHSNFQSILSDFRSDLTITFPEYAHLWAKWDNADELETVFDYCVGVFPERFFDILYQNEEIFTVDSQINTFFLPDVDFKILYNCSGISDKTRKYIWKYLQLILFTIIGEIKDKNNFGETMNMFEGIDENELQNKMKDTMQSINDFFKTIVEEGDDAAADNGDADEGKESGNADAFPKMPKFEGFPNMENIQDHLKTLFEGKIGSLAKEMAEEISGDFSDILGEDMKDIKNTQDVIKKLMKNPKKIMDLMKTVGTKLDQKMKSGEISREEIMKEAGDLFGKMKDMGGQEQFNNMFKNLAKNMGGNLGKNMKLDTNAINRMTKLQEARDRIRKKAEENKKANETKFSLNSKDPNNYGFKLDGEEQQEKSFIHPDILKEMELEDQKKSVGSAETAGGAAAKKKKNKKKTK